MYLSPKNLRSKAKSTEWFFRFALCKSPLSIVIYIVNYTNCNFLCVKLSKKNAKESFYKETLWRLWFEMDGTFGTLLPRLRCGMCHSGIDTRILLRRGGLHFRRRSRFSSRTRRGWFAESDGFVNASLMLRCRFRSSRCLLRGSRRRLGNYILIEIDYLVKPWRIIVIPIALQ